MIIGKIKNSVGTWFCETACQCFLIVFVVSILLLKPSYGQDKFVIGLDADMSAVAAEGGIAIQRGALIAIEEINKNGGVLGKKLELKVMDHRGNPARGINNLEKLSDTKGLIAVLGGVHTPVVLSELETIHQNKLLFLVPWAAGTPIIDNQYNPNYVFRVSVRDAEAAKVLLTDLKTRDIRRVALVLERTGWGRSNLQSMTAEAKKLSVEIVNTSWINWRQSAFDDEIKQIQTSGAEAIVMVANAPEGSVILRSLLSNSETASIPIVSHWGIAGGKFVELLGIAQLSKVNLRVLQTFHFSAANNSNLAKSVINSYRNRFDESAIADSIQGQVGLAHAYDLVHLLVEAIHQAQSIESDSVAKALRELESYNGLVKYYKKPFLAHQDALWADDYIMAEYNADGFLMPIPSKAPIE